MIATSPSRAPARVPLDLLRETDRKPQRPGRARRDSTPEREVEACPNPVTLEASTVDTRTGEMWRDVTADVLKPCGSWGCPVCGPVRQKRHVAHFVEAFAPLSGVLFVTLTLDPKTGLDESESRKYVQHVWSKWRKRLRRLCLKRGSTLRFMRVVEYQSNGHAHVHAIMTAEGVSGDEVAAQWFASGGGVVCDVQELDGDRAELARRVGYVVKYALKDATSPEAPRGRHYVETSEGIGYGSAAAVAKRQAHVAENGDGEASGDDLGAHEVRVWGSSVVPIRPPANPDTVTPEDRERFAALNLEARSTTYRLKDRDGVWWRVEQRDDGTRVRHKLADYRSLYEQRMEAAGDDGGGGDRDGPPG